MVEFVCRICGHTDYYYYNDDLYSCKHCSTIFTNVEKFSLPNYRGFEVVNNDCRKHPDININDIKLPSRSTSKSAGYDFYSPIDFTIYPGQDYKLWTDIKAYMYKDEVLSIFNRSSIANKHNVIIKNITGIIDADYYSNESNDGNIQIRFINNGDVPFSFKGPSDGNPGSKIAQGIFMKYLITYNDIPEEELRKGGIGSTGR